MRLTSTDLEQWAVRLEAREQLPELVSRLIRATIDTRALVQLVMPAGRGIGNPGFDGRVETIERNPWVAEGVSVWEMGCDRDYADKALRDYRKRTETLSPGVDPGQTTFVFVTPWLWSKKKPDLETWERIQCEEGPWKAVRVHDADALVSWLYAAPAVEAWFAELLGRPGPLRALEWSWREWSRATIPSTSEGLVLAGRNDQVERFLSWLRGAPNVLGIRASEPGEVAAFCWAALGRLPQPSRTSHRERALIVFGDDELRRLVLERRPLLLIARDCSYEVARHAASEGHHVVLANSTNSARDLILGSLEPQRAQLELERMGSPQNPHELVKRLRGTQPGAAGVPMAAIRRELGGRDDDLPAELAPLCLVGGWTDQKDDLEVVCAIAGEDEEWLRNLLRQHGTQPISTLVRSGAGADARWRWASRRDAWGQLEPRLTSDIFERFVLAFIDVFAGTRQCSSELRRGLLEGLALLAVEASPTRSEEDRRVPERIVAGLLYPPRSDIWASLAGALRILAEAAPHTFLDCTERFVSNLLETAQENEMEAAPDVIAALEVLAWAEEHLFRVTELLAKISNMRTDGRSREALCDIYLPWSPNTAASAEARAGYLDWLADKHPQLAVELMLSLLSTRTRDVSPGPRYRDWAQHVPEITQMDANEAHVAIWNRVLMLARMDSRHWLVVFPELLRLAPARELRAGAVTEMTQLQMSQLDAGQVETLRGQLRATIHEHRMHAAEHWSLPEPLLAQLEGLYDRLAPADIQDELTWIFSVAPRLLNPSPGTYYEPDAIRNAQRDAAKRLAEELTPNQLVALANRVSYPWALGNALAGLDDTNERAFELLQASIEDAPDGNREFCRGLGHALFRRSNGFAAWHSDAIRALSTEAKAELLLGCPSGPETWDFAESLGPEISKTYWLRAAALFPHEREDLGRVIRSLVDVGRVNDATHLLASARGTGFGSLDSELVVKLLDATLGMSFGVGRGNSMDSYLITALLGQLRTEGSRWNDELLRFEWTTLPILDIYHGGQPRTHYMELARQPEFFVKMVRLANSWYGGDESTRGNSKRARILLEHWHDLPGRRDDGSIDFGELRRWLGEARALLRNSDLSEEGDRRLGEVLAKAPTGADGRWPHEAVREAIEEIGDAPHFRQGLVISRGNRWSDGFVDTERDQARAQQLREDANALRIRYPRTARVLEELATRSEHDAGFWSFLHDQRFDWTSPITTDVRIDRALDEFEADGRLVFDRDTLLAEIGDVPDLLFALGHHRRVAHIDDDLYVIVEPKYRRYGAPPPWWYLDELMRRTNTNYCVGLLSAAALHGAADQQPQIVQVLVSRARGVLKVGVHTIEFVHRDREQPFNSARVNTQTGEMEVATPEATILDLSEFPERCGGDDAVVTILRDLAEEVDAERLVAVATSYPSEVVEHAAKLLGEAGRKGLSSVLRKPSA